MKRILVILAFTLPLGILPARSQSIGDWVQFLLLDYQKLTELRATLSDMQKGYTVIKQGYNSIKEIAEGNFNLHKLFLDGLLAISPGVRDYYRVAAIFEAEYSIVREYKKASASWHAGAWLTGSELDYIDRAYAALFDKSLYAIDELTMVLTADALRMDDAQRLNAIDRVYENITGQLSALRQFNHTTAIQVAQRQKAAGDLETLKQLYGNPH